MAIWLVADVSPWWVSIFWTVSADPIWCNQFWLCQVQLHPNYSDNCLWRSWCSRAAPLIPIKSLSLQFRQYFFCSRRLWNKILCTFETVQQSVNLLIDGCDPSLHRNELIRFAASLSAQFLSDEPLIVFEGPLQQL